MSREAHVRFCEGVEVKFLCATRPLLCRIRWDFRAWYDVRLRLRHINAPERKTPEGQKATKFLTKLLAEVGFVVIKTYSTDLYGRYLADIFTLPNEPDARIVADKGHLVNQILLDNQMAVYVA